MGMSEDTAVARVADDLLPKWHAEREKLDRIDRWARWQHDDPHRPRNASAEHRELAARAQAPWGDLVVGSVAQTLYVEGYRRPEAPEDKRPWGMWQANGLDKRQVAIHRAPLTYGLGYGVSMPGIDPLTGTPMPKMRGVSPREMLALYDDPAWDEWPEIAIRVVTRGDGQRIWVYDDEFEHQLRVLSTGDKPVHMGRTPHNSRIPPVVRYTNRFDLEGRTAGEIEPFIPVLGRIDQTVYDRLVVQRFASWIVRTIAGMDLSIAKRDNEDETQAKLRLGAEDFLVAKDENTKFGALPASELKPFVDAHDDDLQVLSSVSQTPAHEVLGIAANLSAEALAAAEASRTAKSDEHKHTLGEEHEQFFRLGCHQAGWDDAAADFSAQVRWKDTQIRSMAQAADALGKMVQMLGFPAQIAWRKIPNLTDQDLAEAEQAHQAQQGLDVIAEFANGIATDPEFAP